MNSFYRIEYPLSKDFTNLKLHTAPIPILTSPTQVLIKIRAFSLNARDLQIASGVYPAPIQIQAGRIPTSDASGDVVAFGKDVRRFKLNDHVLTIFAQSWLHGEDPIEVQESGLGGGRDGTATQWFVCDQEHLVLAPSHLTHVESCTLAIAALTSWSCLFSHPSAILLPGQTVLILGTGGCSIFAAQLALAAGARVIATSSSDAKLDKLKTVLAAPGRYLGGVNYSTVKEWNVEVRKLTGGVGVDHVVEIGGKGTLVKSVRSVRPRGFVWVVGYMSDYGAKIDGEEQVDMAKEILYSQAIISGVMCGSRDSFEGMNRAIEAGGIRPVVAEVFQFKDIVKAYQYLDTGAFGKVVVTVA